MPDIEFDAFAPTEQQIFEQNNVPELSFDAYQARAKETAVYPGQGALQGLAYTALGLNGEAGETAEQVKKIWRDDSAQSEISLERKSKLTKELGDVLWYAAQLATELGVSLGDVAQDNLEKLAARQKADLLHGEGSDR